ncbi:hypothetical protein MOQ95_005401 [Salmonella enterica]|nr:hypothetical protein [Salmonella enterica]
MKLSPEAKQAIKTAIEQLRLLLVDDAMDTVREEVSKQLMDDGKDKDEKITISGDCRVEGKLSAGKIDGDAERLERLKKTFIQVAKVVINEPDGKPVSKVVLEAPELKVNSGVSTSDRLLRAANFHSFKRIYAEIDKLTEEVKALRSSNKKLKKRVNTLEEWEKIHR